MNKLMKSVILVFVLCAFTLTMQAQKFGYVNSQLILSEMPAVKQANANLDALKTQLQKKGKGMVETLQKEYLAVQQKVEQGVLSPQQQQAEAQKLEAKQKEIADFEQKMAAQIGEKQQKLLEPILKQVNDAINEVAKEQGYTMIFDATAGILLYAEEDADLSTQVKAKLGI